MRTLMGHSCVRSFAFSRDGKRIASGSGDGPVKIWNAETGVEVSSHACTRWSLELDWVFGGGKAAVSGVEHVLIWGVMQVCTLTGHSHRLGRKVQVAFSGDGAQVVSAGGDNTVRFFDVASGRQVRQLAGSSFALLEGLSGEHITDRHVMTANGDTLRIYEYAEEQQHAEDGAVEAPVAYFKAPLGDKRRCNDIFSVRCVGATICVGCCDMAVCVLSAPFLAA